MSNNKNLKYKWERLWLPFGTTYYHDHLGFPSFTHYNFGTAQSTSDALTLKQLEDIECLILLGEPGSGKTTEVRNISHGDNFRLTYELNKRSSEFELFQGITNQVEFKNWLTSEKYLYLYLDGLDEALLNIKTMRNAIVDWLNTNKEEFNIGSSKSRKFRFRITCRSAIWSQTTTAELNQIFEPHNVQVYELAPLTQKEIKIAAKFHDFNEEDFVNTIVERDMISLTSEPVSLKFLISSFETGKLQDQSFDKTKMFYEGALHLATEINQMHKDHLVLTTEERVRIACRIATYLLLCDKSTIWKDESRSGVTSEDLVLDEIVGDEFISDGKNVELRLSSVKETLNTALFGLTEESRLNFKHRTYAEFLTAIHLNTQKLDINVLAQFLSSHFDKARAIPQLQEVLIWLGTVNDIVFAMFLDQEPLLILKIHRTFTVKERSRLVKAILNQTTKYQITDNFDTRKFYNKLSHPNLAKQLLPFLKPRDNTIAMRTAIDIAGACRVTELGSELLKIVHDKKIKSYIRKEAINSLSEIDANDTFPSLKELVVNEIGQDDEDEVKGAALAALYPGYISTSEVIMSLTQVKNRNLYGSYRAFIDSFADLIPASDLHLAIEHLAVNNNVFKRSSNNYFEKLLTKVFSRAWAEVNKGISPALMAKFLKRFYECRIPIDFEDVQLIRHAVAREIIYHHREAIRPYDLIDKITHRGNALISANDWEWLLGIIKTESDDEVLEYAARISKYFFNHNDGNRVVEFFEIIFQKPKVLEIYQGWLKAIDLDSDVANDLKSNLQSSEQTIDLQPQTKEPLVQDIGVEENIISHLTKFETGEIDEWWRLIWALGLSDKNEFYNQSDFEFDITKLNGWSKIDEAIKERVKKSCRNYLLTYLNPMTDWIYSNEYNRRELAGYKALFHLVKIGDSTVDNLNTDFWDNWQPIIFYCIMNHFGEKNDIHQKILQLSYAKSSSLYRKTIGNYFSRRLNEKKDLFGLYKVREIIDEKLAPTLLDLIVVPHTESNESILEILFANKIALAREFVWKQLDELYKGKSKDQTFSIQASAFLFGYPNQQNWDKFWNKLIQNQDLAKRIVLRGSNFYGLGEERNLKSLTPAQLSPLLVWLFRNFPPKEDPVHNSAYSPTGRDNVADLRQNIVRHLIELGSVESVDALAKVASYFKKDENFKWWIVSAREFLRKNTWVPLDPKHLRILLNNAKNRVVRSEGDLASIVEESLKRFQKKLQGENPSAFFLWNKNKIGSYSPKDENTLSDFIKLHLDYDFIERGIVINREVEIKHTTGRKDGQRTDLYIQAYEKNGGTPLTVVVEVKGCWHQEVDTSMEKQLKKRYLSKYKSTHGLFVVGWFYCTHFRPRTKSTRTLLQNKLHRQAKQLSDGSTILNSLVLDCTI